MPELGKATYELVFNTTEYDANMEHAEAGTMAATDKMGAAFTKTDEKIATLGPSMAKASDSVVAGAVRSVEASNRVTASFLRLGDTAKNALGFVGAFALYEAVKKGVETLKENDQAMAQLTATVKDNGAVTKLTTKNAEDYADELAKHVPITKAVIEAAEAQLGTMRSISAEGGKNSQFYQILTVAMDISQKKHIELSAAVKLLGRAFTDPVAGMGAMNRAGIALDAQTKAYIKTLASEGKLQEARAIMLKKVQDAYQGSADAAGKTFTGQLTIAKNAINEQSAVILTALIPAFVKLANVLADVAKLMGEHKTATSVVILGFIALLGVVVAVKLALGAYHFALDAGKLIMGIYSKAAALMTTETVAETAAVEADAAAHLNLQVVLDKGQLSMAKWVASTQAATVAETEAAAGAEGMGLSLMSLQGAIPVIGAVAAALGILELGIHRVKAAQDEADAAIANTGTQRAAELSYYAEKVQAYKALGSTLDEARTKAAADTSAHFGEAFSAQLQPQAQQLGQSFTDQMSAAMTAAAPGAADKAAKEVGMPLVKGVLLGWAEGWTKVPANLAKNVRDLVDKLSGEIKTDTGKFSTAFARLSSDAFKAFDAETSRGISAIDTRLNAAIAGIQVKMDALRKQADAARAQADAETTNRFDAARQTAQDQNKVLTPAEQQIKDITDARAASDLAKQLADAKKALQDAMAGGDKAVILQAQADLAKAEENIQLSSLQKQAAVERAAADAKLALQQKSIQTQQDAALKANQDAYDAKVASLDAQQKVEETAATTLYDSQKLNYQAQRDLQKQHLQDFMDQTEAFLEKHPGQWRKVFGKDGTLMHAFKDEFGPGMKLAAKNLGAAFVTGLKESFTAVEAAVSTLNTLLSNIGNFNSDRAPLRSKTTVISDFEKQLADDTKQFMVNITQNYNNTPSDYNVSAHKAKTAAHSAFG